MNSREDANIGENLSTRGLEELKVLNKEKIIKIINDLPEKDRNDILEELSMRKRNSEMKEKLREVPTLEKKNFRIPEMLTESWKIKTKIGIVNDKKVKILVKENPEGDIWEYITGVPKELIGEQLFMRDAAIRETKKVGKELPDIDVFLNDFQLIMDTMPGENEETRYQNFLAQHNISFAGFRYPKGDFVGIGKESNLWSKNPYGTSSARYSQFLKDSWLRIEYHKCLAFSVRCIK